MRLACLLPLVCLGCHLAWVDPGKAERLWQEGQAAMKTGDPDAAIALYHRSLAEDGQRFQNHLSLAAAYVDKGDDDRACHHLEKFLEAQPDHRDARFYYAELLLRRQCFAAAHTELERSVADAQQEPEPDLTHLVHCHTRLVASAEGLEDAYHEHLHRGIGLYLLAQARRQVDDPDAELSVEGLLCRAAGELAQAQARRPHEARPCLYLHAAWRQLGQQQLAQRWLRQAQHEAPFTHLTPAEQARLQLALGTLPAPNPLRR